MKAKLIVEGKEFEVEIQDLELQKLIKSPKKTGYEREHDFWYEFNGTVNYDADDCYTFGQKHYDAANYYSDKTVAENNARADKLMRQLRRFSVEHRKNEINWRKDLTGRKWAIYYIYDDEKLAYDAFQLTRDYFTIYFDSEETVRLAIDTFHDELIWYFTEYKDSL